MQPLPGVSGGSTGLPVRAARYRGTMANPAAPINTVTLSLHSECPQQEETRDQGSQDRTDGVGEVEETGVPAHEPGGALDDRVGKGKGKPHEKRRNRPPPAARAAG